MFRKSLFFIVCLAIPCLVFADTIYLKNGKQIKDVEVTEEGNAFKYMKFGQEISLPKANVDRIERIEISRVKPNSDADKTDEHIEEPNLNEPPDLSSCPKVKIWEYKVLRYWAFLNKHHTKLIAQKLQANQDEVQKTLEAKELDKEIEHNESQERLCRTLKDDIKTKKKLMNCGD